MTKYLLISIRPQHVYNILTGIKTLEIRKMIPKWVFEAITNGETVKALIYCTKKKPLLTYDVFDWDSGWQLYDSEDEFYSHHAFHVNGKVVAQFDLNRIEKIICNNEPDYYGEIDGDYGFEVGDIKCIDEDDEGCLFVPSDNYEYYDSSRICKEACIEFEDMDEYFATKDGYAMFIKNLKVFDKPKELGDYYKDFAYSDTDEYGRQHNPTLIPLALERAPQSMQKVWGDE